MRRGLAEAGGRVAVGVARQLRHRGHHGRRTYASGRASALGQHDRLCRTSTRYVNYTRLRPLASMAS